MASPPAWTQTARSRSAKPSTWPSASEKNGKAYFEFILQAIRAYFRDRPAPSLLPGFT